MIVKTFFLLVWYHTKFHLIHNQRENWLCLVPPNRNENHHRYHISFNLKANIFPVYQTGKTTTIRRTAVWETHASRHHVGPINGRPSNITTQWYRGVWGEPWTGSPWCPETLQFRTAVRVTVGGFFSQDLWLFCIEPEWNGGDKLYGSDPVGPCSNPRISFQFCQKIIAYAIQWTKWLVKLSVFKILHDCYWEEIPDILWSSMHVMYCVLPLVTATKSTGSFNANMFQNISMIQPKYIFNRNIFYSKMFLKMFWLSININMCLIKQNKWKKSFYMLTTW